MLKLAIRDVIAHFTRFILTVLSVILGVAFLSGTLALRSDLESTMANAFASSTIGTIQIEGQRLTPSSSERNDVPAGLATMALEVDGVTAAAPRHYLPVTVLDKDDAPFSGVGIQTILANSTPGFPQWTQEGPEPQGKDEILLEKSALERFGFEVGDRIGVVIGGSKYEMTIVSSTSFTEPVSFVNVLLMHQDTVEEFVPDPQVASSVSVQTAPDADINRVILDIEGLVGSKYEVRTTEEVNEDFNKDIERILGFVTTFLLVFIVLALGVSTFIIANTFHMAVKARQKEFAYLRAIGASPAQVFVSVALQALIVGLIGSILGIFLGSGLLVLADHFLTKLAVTSGTATTLTVSTITTSIVVGTVTTLIGAIIPARTAAQTPPVEAMREVSGVREPTLLPRSIVGFVLVITGLVGIYMGATHAVERDGLAIGIGAGGLVLGVLSLSPALVAVIIGVLAFPLRLTKSLTARLATGNTTRNPRRTAATAGALVIGMGLVAAGTILADSVRVSLSDELQEQVKADLLINPISPADTISDDTLNRIRNTAGVKETNGEYIIARASTLFPSKNKPVVSMYVSMPEESFDTEFIIPLEDGELSAIFKGEIAVAKSLADTYDVSVGDTVTITGLDGDKKVRVGAIHDTVLWASTIIVTPETLDELKLPTQGRIQVTVFADSDRSIDEVKANLKQTLKSSYTLAVLDKSDLETRVTTTINSVLSIIYALLALSIVIAVLGIINTLGLSVSERKTEIALMRAIGLSQAGTGLTITIEAILTSIYGTVLGLAVGITAATGLIRYLDDSGISTLSVPWPAMMWMIVGSVVVGVFASLLPAVRAARQPVLQAIATE
ncbi:MAG: FtsX-like permease family protein [Actinomycetaceae bacterium]|nr:FtsX-like permease family protein [Actinomycetaceae bacterium]